MIKSELVQKFCNMYPNLLRKDVEKILEIVFSEITKALCRGENIEIRGFGTYKITMRKARIGRNPKTAKTIQIPAKKAIKWKMSKTMYKRLNKNFTESNISSNY